MRKKKEKIVIAYLKDYTVDEIYERHIVSFCNEREHKPSKAILTQKYQYLLHIIITRCKLSDKGVCHLNTAFYRDKLFHDHYNQMLLNLCYMNIIDTGTYTVGKESTAIYLLNWNIDYMTSYNVKYIEWSKREKERFDSFVKVEATPFTEQYTESLLCLRLSKKEEALSFIDEAISDKHTHKYQHHKACIECFEEKDLRLYKIDEQGRIYHYLTSLPKTLRPFCNIKYELDIANSHPLLLNYYLQKHYNIYNIKKEGNPPIYHYDVEKPHSKLNDNSLGVPCDILEYIDKTQRGVFYDDFIEEFGDIERSEVKKKVFSQVFYSHIDDKYVSKFRRAFIDKYPNVWTVIKTLKAATADKLPHLMMSAESGLFRHILDECWKRGYKVVNIHDALVVLDVKENEDVLADEFEGIIKSVYRRAKLLPTVKMEIGG